jgi:hypothetical protein
MPRHQYAEFATLWSKCCDIGRWVTPGCGCTSVFDRTRRFRRALSRQDSHTKNHACKKAAQPQTFGSSAPITGLGTHLRHLASHSTSAQFAGIMAEITTMRSKCSLDNRKDVLLAIAAYLRSWHHPCWHFYSHEFNRRCGRRAE